MKCAMCKGTIGYYEQTEVSDTMDFEGLGWDLAYDKQADVGNYETVESKFICRQCGCEMREEEEEMLDATFIYDPGHGWLKVPLNEVLKLGIEKQISAYSYVQGDYAYLEEDCDAPLFEKAYCAKNNITRERLVEDTPSVYQEQTPIRGYERYGTQASRM